MREPAQRGRRAADDAGVDVLYGYELGDVLGTGPRTRVQRARRAHCPELAFAVKRAASPGAGGELAGEARLLAPLDHPNVVRLVDVVPDGDQVALVMPLARGGSLAARLRRGRLPAHQVVDLLLDVTAGVASLHGAGVVHGDVKPSNLLLTGDGRPLVADLGSAAEVGAAGTGRGSGSFAAPELAAGAPARFDQDVYGLGATALALLSGRALRAGAAGAADLGVSRRLAAVLEACLDERPIGRFPTAAALWAALASCPEAARLGGGRLSPVAA